MQKEKVCTAVLMIFTAAVLAGCVTTGTYSVGCSVHSDHEWECNGRIEGHYKRGVDPQVALAGFDATALKVDVSQSNVLFKQTAKPSIVVSLKNDTKVIAARSFGASMVGGAIALENPDELTSFLHRHSQSFNAWKVSVQGLEPVVKDGTNTFTMELYYQNELLGGAADSFYASAICRAKPWLCSPVNY